MGFWNSLFSAAKRPIPPPRAKVRIFAGQGPIGPFLFRRLRHRYRVELIPLLYLGAGLPDNGTPTANPYDLKSLLPFVEEDIHAVFTDRFLKLPTDAPSDLAGVGMGTTEAIGAIASGGNSQANRLTQLSNFAKEQGATVWHPGALERRLRMAVGPIKGRLPRQLASQAQQFLLSVRANKEADSATTVFFDESGLVAADDSLSVAEVAAQAINGRKPKTVFALRLQMTGAPPEIQTPMLDNALLAACNKHRLGGVFFDASSVVRAPDFEPAALERGILAGL